MTQHRDIDEYIASCDPAVQDKLRQLRGIIKAAAPAATEKISYGMPTFYLNGNLVHFAAFKHHIGFYPAPEGIERFKDELAAYKTSKGAAQFLLDKPLPLELVEEIVKFRAGQNTDR